MMVSNCFKCFLWFSMVFLLFLIVFLLFLMVFNWLSIVFNWFSIVFNCFLLFLIVAYSRLVELFELYKIGLLHLRRRGRRLRVN